MTSYTSTTQTTPFRVNRAVLAGGAGGLLGGMAMAMFSMFVAITRDGFWAPVRGITSVVFGDKYYGGGFDFWPVVAGVGGHMMNSVILGVLFAVLAGVLFRRASAITIWMAGAVYGVMIWAVMVLGVAHVLQRSDLFADSVPQWAWIAGHVMFGAITGMAVSMTARHDQV